MASEAKPRKRTPKVSAEERAKRARRLAAAYKKGMTIREIAVENGYSYGYVHTLLTGHGAQLRSRGGSPRARRP